MSASIGGAGGGGAASGGVRRLLRGGVHTVGVVDDVRLGEDDGVDLADIQFGRNRRAQPVIDGLHLGDLRSRLLHRTEQLRMLELVGRWIIARDDDAHAEPGDEPEPRRKIGRHADAAMGGRIAGQEALMHRYARPGQALHVEHRGGVIQVRSVPTVLLDDAEDTGRRGVAGRAGRDLRLRNPCAVGVQRHVLLADRDHHLQRTFRQGTEWLLVHHLALLAVLAGNPTGLAIGGVSRVDKAHDEGERHARCQRFAPRRPSRAAALRRRSI